MEPAPLTTSTAEIYRTCRVCGGPLDASLVCTECPGAEGKSTIHIQPHPGAQTQFVLSEAWLTFFGGARGGGKSRTGITRGLAYRPKLSGGYQQPMLEDERFVGMVFRKEAERMRKKGGIWAELKDVYEPLGGKSNQNEMSITMPCGAAVQCAGLKNKADYEKYRGLAFNWILVEEGTEISEVAFDALVRCSRPRSRSETAPWIDVTCNPDPDSWILKYIDRFLDDEGYPDPAMSGKLLWFVTGEDGQIVWVDELFEREPELAAMFDHDPSKYVDRSVPEEPVPAMSVTYIPSFVADNPTIAERDHTYVAQLRKQKAHVVEGDLRGCWYARADSTTFSESRWHYIDPQNVPPEVWAKAIRYWDQASTRAEEHSTPDATAGALTAHVMCPCCDGWRFDREGAPCSLCNTMRNADGEVVPIQGVGDVPMKEEELESTFWVLDVRTIYGSPGEVEKFTADTAREDGYRVPVYIEEESGASGKNNTHNYSTRILKGYEVFGDRPTGSKTSRAEPLAGAAERGLVFVVRGLWVNEFNAAKNKFPGAGRDVIDATTGGYHMGQSHDWTTDEDDGWGAAVT